jgi:hypothetical protein
VFSLHHSSFELEQQSLNQVFYQEKEVVKDAKTHDNDEGVTKVVLHLHSIAQWRKEVGQIN